MFSFFRQRPAATKPTRRNYRPQLEAFEDRLVPTAGISVVYFASSVPGQYGLYDPSLVYPYSIAVSPTGQVAIGVGAGQNPSIQLFDFNSPSAPTTIHFNGYLDGLVYNSTNGFEIESNGNSAPAEFVLSVYSGNVTRNTISGYSPLLASNQTIAAVNLAQNEQVGSMAIGTDANGNSFLYAIDYDNGPATVRVFDSNFNPVSVSPSAFRDPNFTSNNQFQYANSVQVAGDHVFVNFNLYDSSTFTSANVVDEFNLDGAFVRSITLPINGPLINSFAIAPADVPTYGGDLLITDYSTGEIDTYSLDTGAYLGPMADSSGAPIVIPQLENIVFGPNIGQGSGESLYFVTSEYIQSNNTDIGMFGVIEFPPIATTPISPTQRVESMLLQTTPQPGPAAATSPVLPLHDFAPAAPPLVPEGASAPSLSKPDAEEGPGWIANDAALAPALMPIAPVAQAPAGDPVPTTAVIAAPDLPTSPTTVVPPTVPVDGDQGPPVETKPTPNADPEQSMSSRIEKPIDMRGPSETRLGAMPIVAALGAGSYLTRPGKANRERKRRKQMSARR
jgi:uncharacterized protein (TIGR03118 family)